MPAAGNCTELQLVKNSRCVLLAVIWSILPWGSLGVEPGEWQLVWSDEFETDGLPDARWWSYEEGYVRNNELQYYTRERQENARVEGGNLVLEARKDNWQGNAYTSASLTTRETANWTYGRFEVRAQVPAGRGTWPAIWMLGTNIGEVGWPDCGEIDIMEYVGYQPNTIHGTVHTKAYNHIQNTGRGAQVAIGTAEEAMHVYSVEWDENEIRFYVDGNQYHSFAKEAVGGDATWPFYRPQYLILNYAVGGAWGGSQGVDGSIFPSQYKVDYVRVYQRKEAGPYSLSTQVSGPGILHVEPEKESYEDGEVVRLMADPDVGMRFKGWSGMQAERALVAELTMDRDREVGALFVEPGGLLRNGDFAAGLEGYYNWVSDQATAGFAVVDGALRGVVSRIGPEAWHVQWGQGGVALQQGKRYRLAFEGWTASGTASIDAKLALNVEPFSSFVTQPIELSATRQRFEVNYTHSAATAPNSRVEFNVSKKLGTYYFDKVSLQSLDDESLGPYEAWKRENGLRPTDDGGDSDGDGVPNVFEYLYRRRPDLAEPMTGSLAVLAHSSDTLWLELGEGALAEAELVDVTLRREVSQDLASWEPAEAPVWLSEEGPVFLRMHATADVPIE